MKNVYFETLSSGKKKLIPYIVEINNFIRYTFLYMNLHDDLEEFTEKIRSALSRLEKRLNHPEKEHARWDARLIVPALN